MSSKKSSCSPSRKMSSTELKRHELAKKTYFSISPKRASLNCVHTSIIKPNSSKHSLKSWNAELLTDSSSGHALPIITLKNVPKIANKDVSSKKKWRPFRLVGKPSPLKEAPEQEEETPKLK